MPRMLRTVGEFSRKTFVAEVIRKRERCQDAGPLLWFDEGSGSLGPSVADFTHQRRIITTPGSRNMSRTDIE